MGLGAYFRGKKVAWAARDERRYDRAAKFMSMSQENFGLVTGGFLFIGFAIGISVLLLEPLMGWNPIAFVGLMMVVLVVAVGVVNFIIGRKMKKAGV